MELEGAQTQGRSPDPAHTPTQVLPTSWPRSSPRKSNIRETQLPQVAANLYNLEAEGQCGAWSWALEGSVQRRGEAGQELGEGRGRGSSGASSRACSHSSPVSPDPVVWRLLEHRTLAVGWTPGGRPGCGSW